MILTGIILLALVAAYLAGAAWISAGRKINFHQALLYLPLKLLYRIDDHRAQLVTDAPAPVIYVITHRSRVDPALMLALLPSNTLHILDETSAKSMRLEPFRALARTIAFNAEHLFVSRRLVRHLRGKGRLAVYLPEAVEPSPKGWLLYRAISRIASRADARIVPIFVDGYSKSAPGPVKAQATAMPSLPRLSITALPPATIAELADRSVAPSLPPSNILFDRVAESRFAAADLSRPLFSAIRDAADQFAPSSVIMEDVVMGALSYRKLFIAARVVAGKVAPQVGDAHTVGVLLPNANGVVIALLCLWSSGKAAAMINYTAGPANVASAVKTAAVRTVISSRAFIEKAGIADIAQAVESTGAKIVWLEDVRETTTTLDKLLAAVLWRVPREKVSAEKPAVVLFTSGSEGTPKAVVLSHRNLLANAMQVEARLALTPADKLLNVLPVFHSYGLTGGTILPLLIGVRTLLYPSPLHYKLIPDVAKKARPSIMFATDTFLKAYAQSADDDDFASLRLVVAGAEPLKAETRRIWKERFGAEIVEGFGMTEAAPVVAVNSATHGKHGSVGRLLPAMQARLEPVEGIEEGGRLWVKGPNVMMGYMTADRPGQLQPLSDAWHDSGDIVAIDREGYLTIKGRAKRFAKIAGEMISLGAIEMLVQSLWPEERHAVVSVPDKRRGERIVLVTTEDEADSNALRQHGKMSGISELMLPSDIITVPEIPVLGSGKTDYVTTQKLAMERLGHDKAA
jgi:acyl-[acyl-carrier-protein]-phospholipid O-acyltransferase/long-chain-fatty-acid--[acyl-carrier-protein] ligase